MISRSELDWEYAHIHIYRNSSADLVVEARVYVCNDMVNKCVAMFLDV